MKKKVNIFNVMLNYPKSVKAIDRVKRKLIGWVMVT